MEELEKTFLEEYIGASEELTKGRFKNATILFSKALFALCDLIIYLKLRKLPKNHTERFSMLREQFPKSYVIVDEVFGYYTDAYSKPALRETSEVIKNAIRKIAGDGAVSEKIKKIVA